MRSAAMMRKSRWAKEQRKQIGDNIGTTSARRSVTIEDSYTINSRLLYISELVQNLPEGTGNDARMRDNVNLRGWRIMANVTNLSFSQVWLNIAIVSPREDGDLGVSTTAFFRSYGAQRGINFNDNLNSADFHCRPINTDKYHILMHRRFMIGMRPPSGAVSDGNVLMFIRYVTLKRQVRFNVPAGSEDPETTNDRFWLVQWCDVNDSPIGTPSQTDVLSWINKTVTYFRNTKD